MLNDVHFFKDLNSKADPGTTFSMHIKTNAMNGYQFCMLPAKPLTAILAYDAIFHEKFQKGHVFNQDVYYADPAIRADKTFSKDFFKVREEWNSDNEQSAKAGMRVGILNLDSKGNTDFTNGKHRTRAFYSFGMKNIPLDVEATRLPILQKRMAEVSFRMEQGKRLFPMKEVVKSFTSLKTPSSLDELKENAQLFLKLTTAKSPEDLFFSKKDFKPGSKR